MNTAVTLDEAAGDFRSLIARLRAIQQDVVVTSDGRPIARIVPFQSVLTGEARIASIGSSMERWYANTTEEERESFARDIESARTVVDQTIPNRWE